MSLIKTKVRPVEADRDELCAEARRHKVEKIVGRSDCFLSLTDLAKSRGMDESLVHQAMKQEWPAHADDDKYANEQSGEEGSDDDKEDGEGQSEAHGNTSTPTSEGARSSKSSKKS